MPTDVLLPQWGMGMNEGQVVKWLKSEGDEVTKGDPLVEIESAKVNSEVEAPADGLLGKILVSEGVEVPVGSRLAVMLSPGEDPSVLESIEAPVASGPQARPTPTPSLGARSRPSGGRRQVITPRARRLANELGVDLGAVEGTGPSGRVTEDDVRRAAESAAAGPSTVPVRETIPLIGLRGAIAKRMAESSQAPTVTLNTHADVTAAVELQRRLTPVWRPHRLRPQYQDLALAAVAAALVETPIANAHLVGEEVRVLDEVNLGVAVAIPEGLVVPVIRNADGMSLLELAQEVRQLARKAKSRSLGAEEMTGGTFTITNLGAYDVEHFDPLLNPPEVGILGLGKVEDRPSIIDGEVQARSIGHLSLTFDHRAWDGAPAAAFLSSVVRRLSDPGWMVG